MLTTTVTHHSANYATGKVFSRPLGPELRTLKHITLEDLLQGINCKVNVVDGNPDICSAIEECVAELAEMTKE